MRTLSWRCVARVSAFTRVELIAVLATLGLICTIVIPSLGQSGNRSERLVCLNNLGQLGRAYQMWATDHEGLLPFLVPTSRGGIQAHSMSGNIYFQVALLSNELRTAAVLACPSDTTAQRAANFSTGEGGLLNPRFQNNAVSYFVTHPSDGLETGLLAGDRNLEGTTGASGCPYFLGVTALDGRFAAWRENIHMSSGNVLFQNGAAEQTGNIQLRNLLRPPDLIGGGGAQSHLVMRPQ
jgi:type II secretory pathway pseudopilin PulG